MEVEQREVSGMALAWSRTARLQAHAPRMQGYKVKGFSQIRSQWHRQGWVATRGWVCQAFYPPCILDKLLHGTMTAQCSLGYVQVG